MRHSPTRRSINRNPLRKLIGGGDGPGFLGRLFEVGVVSAIVVTGLFIYALLTGKVKPSTKDQNNEPISNSAHTTAGKNSEFSVSFPPEFRNSNVDLTNVNEVAKLLGVTLDGRPDQVIYKVGNDKNSADVTAENVARWGKAYKAMYPYQSNVGLQVDKLKATPSLASLRGQ